MAEPIKLPPKLDLPAAVPLLTDLRGVEGDIVLDGSEVTHLGALCLQVMSSAAKTAKSAGHDFRLENLSDAAIGQLRFMGVAPESLAGSEQ